MDFLKANRLDVVEAAATAGTSTLTTDTVDMSNFDECTFIALLGDVTDTSVLTLTIHHSDDDSSYNATTCAATFTAGASDADSKIIAVSINKPLKRYLRGVLTRATANAVLGGIIAIQSKPRDLPVTQDATVISSETEAGSDTA